MRTSGEDFSDILGGTDPALEAFLYDDPGELLPLSCEDGVFQHGVLLAAAGIDPRAIAHIPVNPFGFAKIVCRHQAKSLRVSKNLTVITSWLEDFAIRYASHPGLGLLAVSPAELTKKIEEVGSEMSACYDIFYEMAGNLSRTSILADGDAFMSSGAVQDGEILFGEAVAKGLSASIDAYNAANDIDVTSADVRNFINAYIDMTDSLDGIEFLELKSLYERNL